MALRKGLKRKFSEIKVTKDGALIRKQKMVLNLVVIKDGDERWLLEKDKKNLSEIKVIKNGDERWRFDKETKDGA
ncbi:hypothetical protein BpHYR1_000671 [Brachionus plicatilis]|uniref:Uncharacterized protein n=1 Tax=Brachionus plicatilis TaxID=10195 RepID=A0A3M7Q0G8_BRAPC|nr:hypothetical protein BpHYR1_000671 [Brachionus plicatilis]